MSAPRVGGIQCLEPIALFSADDVDQDRVIEVMSSDSGLMMRVLGLVSSSDFGIPCARVRLRRWRAAGDQETYQYNLPARDRGLDVRLLHSNHGVSFLAVCQPMSRCCASRTICGEG